MAINLAYKPLMKNERKNNNNLAVVFLETFDSSLSDIVVVKSNFLELEMQITTYSTIALQEKKSFTGCLFAGVSTVVAVKFS